MVVKYISVEEGFQLAMSNGVASVNLEPDFISVIADAFNVEPVCIIVTDKNKPLIGLVLYTKGRSIVHPTPYIYTGFWKASNSNLVIENAFIEALKKMQTDYLFISLLLPPVIFDIRAFIYRGFKSQVQYTYINDLRNIRVSGNVKSRVNKSIKLDINFAMDAKGDYDEVLEQNLASFRKLGYSFKYINRLQKLISGLVSAGYLMPASARLGKDLIASGFILFDVQNKHAMNLFITSNKNHYDTGVHSSLYHFILVSLRNRKFITNDLYGATTKGIGNFKSNFNGNLVPFYLVKYNFLRWKAVKISLSFKRMVKKIRAFFIN